MNENIEVLEEVLNVLEEEKEKFYNLLSQNEFRIEEINSYLRELSKREDEDFKVFSPRNVENKHREQIEADTSEKKRYEEENKEYQKKIDALKTLIDKVNIVIGNLQIFEKQKKQVSEENDSKYNGEGNINNDANSNIEKNHIAHQILNCVSFIPFDKERTKIELTALSKKLMNEE